MKKLVPFFCLFSLLISPVCLQANPNSFPYTSDSNNASISHLRKHTFTWLKDFQGWCSQQKATYMMDLIIATKPKLCVEIGVCGGSSSYPTLMALLYNQANGKNGILYAIDPWKNDEATKYHDPKNEHTIWWSRVDLQTIKANFIKNLERHQLNNLCIIIPKTSQEAINQIPSEIDILHIDGNHSEEASVLDVTLYLPKVREGGYIWFNDFNSESFPALKNAALLLEKTCDLIYQNEQTNGGSFALFRKKSALEKPAEKNTEIKTNLTPSESKDEESLAKKSNGSESTGEISIPPIKVKKVTKKAPVEDKKNESKKLSNHSAEQDEKKIIETPIAENNADIDIKNKNDEILSIKDNDYENKI